MDHILNCNKRNAKHCMANSTTSMFVVINNVDLYQLTVQGLLRQKAEMKP